MESPELIDLFTTYTAAPDSIGQHLAEAAGDTNAAAPLLVATGTDLALYPGLGRAPETLGFRMSTRGFKELAGISHLGPALASLVPLKESRPAQWRGDAERLLAACHRAKGGNGVALWRDVIAVDAYRGREEAIAAMIDYALDLTIGYLDHVLADPAHLNFTTLRREVLEDGELPVSMNRIMIATFFLVGMDISHRLITWLDQQDLNWDKTMVLIAGKQGRPTAGVTWRTNSVAAMILAAGRGALPLDHVYLAPHAPVFPTPRGDLTDVTALEPTYRALWAGTRAVVDLAGSMFPGSPRFSPDAGAEITIGTGSLGDMPSVSGPDDWTAMIARLRLVLEDPRQLLSGAVSDYAANLLAARGNDPSRLTVPGLDGEPYPAAPR